jgi:2Fe-2S iron-sulfur cluster binding domain
MGMSETSISGHRDAAGTTVSRRWPVELTVNGQLHSMAVKARTTLLDARRDELRLTGTKKECDRGECGAACTVHVVGRRILSCITLAAMQDGKQITTTEGLEQDGTRSFFAAARAECLTAATRLISFTFGRSATERISRGTSPTNSPTRF